MIIILLGPPGAGKGTTANELTKKGNIPVISTGDILRNAIKNKTSLGEIAQSYVKSGKLVPDNLIMKIIEERITENDCKKGFMFDGFPRTIKQAKDLDCLIKYLNIKLDQVFYFETSKSIVIKRLSSRRVCTNCGAIYNLNYDPPKINGKCDKCRGDLVQRDDDKEETTLNRLVVFNKKTLPLVDYYREKNILTVVNADQDLNDRLEEILSRLNELNLIKKDRIW